MPREKSTRPVGRPPSGVTPQRSIRMDQSMYDAIRKWQKKREDTPMLTTSDAIRELIMIALLKEQVIDEFGTLKR